MDLRRRASEFVRAEQMERGSAVSRLDREELTSLSALVPVYIARALRNSVPSGYALLHTPTSALLFSLLTTYQKAPQGWEENARQLDSVLQHVPIAPIGFRLFVRRKVDSVLDTLLAEIKAIEDEYGPLMRTEPRKVKVQKLREVKEVIVETLTKALQAAAARKKGAAAGMEIMWMLRNYQVCALSPDGLLPYCNHLLKRFSA